MRALALVAAASAVFKLGSLALAWNATADAAQPVATRPDTACGADGRSFRELLETVRAKSDELARRESALRTRESGLAATRRRLRDAIARTDMSGATGRVRFDARGDRVSGVAVYAVETTPEGLRASPRGWLGDR